MMLKDEETGVLEKELAVLDPGKDGGLLSAAYAVTAAGALEVRMFVTTGRDVLDWEYEAIYDYYDAGIFDGLGLEVTESPSGSNPVWEIRFPYVEDPNRLSSKLQGILALHKRELDAVCDEIRGMEDSYNDL